MPHISGAARRSRPFLFRFGTSGTGSPSTLWPPIDTPTAFPGTPVGIGGPVSRSRIRRHCGPSVSPTALTPGSPVMIRGPVSRARPRTTYGPSNYVPVGPATDITSVGSNALAAIASSFVGTDMQQDLWDTGSPPTISSQAAVLVGAALALIGVFQVGGSVLAASASAVVGGGFAVGNEISGSGVLSSLAAETVGGQIELLNRMSGQVASEPASFVGAVIELTAPAFTIEQIFDEEIDVGPGIRINLRQAIRIILAAAAAENSKAGQTFEFKSLADPSKTIIAGETNGAGIRSNVRPTPDV